MERPSPGEKELITPLELVDRYITTKTVNIDHQLQRYSDMSYHIETTKTSAGKRKIPIPAGENLSEHLDANGYIGFPKLAQFYGAAPVVVTE